MIRPRTATIAAGVGFVLAVTSITGFQKGATALAAGVPILIFALPILDTVSAVVRRLLRAPESPNLGRWAGLANLVRPDRQHIHHYLVSRGGRTVTVPATPRNGRRALANARANLRRIGADL